MNATVIEVGYGIAAVAFLALLILAGLSRIRSRQRLILLIVTGANFAWALAIVCSPLIRPPVWLLVGLEVARLASWLVFITDLMGLVGQRGAELRLLKFFGLGLPVAVVGYVIIQPALQIYAGINWLPRGSDALLIVIPVAGILLLENLLRNTDRDTRWAVKYFCIAIGVIFIYDFFYFADVTASGRPNTTLFAARGFVNAMMVPLIAVGVARSRSWPVAIHVSRGVIFHSFALIGSGLYLLTMAAASYYVRHVNGEWGPSLQLIFLIGAASILAVILASGSMRARVRYFISRNFFSLKYDYRETWMHFVGALSSTSPELGLQRRLLSAVADLVDSTAAGLWIRSEEAATYIPQVSTNLGDALPTEPLGSSLEDWFRRHHTVIELAEATDERRYPNLQLPDWLRTLTRGWLLVPLIHRDLLQGFIVLGEPRITRSLDWEDYELLMAIGNQAASYIAEEQSTNALSESRQLQLVSRRFAFVAHDLKNIVGQLTLMLSNARRFKDNAQFRSDMFETIVHSVDRMNALLDQLRSMRDDTGIAIGEPIAPGLVLKEVADTWERDRPGFSADLQPISGLLRASPERLRSVVEHLVQNAFDAAGDEGRVALRARAIEDAAIIEVEDDGPGMDLEFVQQKLFRPFVSTRPTGFGIGAYQIREYVRSMGGQLEVRSVPGKGTTMQVFLPLIASEQVDVPTTAEAIAS